MTSMAPFDKRELRNVLGTFVTGVTVVTTRDAQGRAFGVTANSFNSVSLDPPLVLWSQSTSTGSYPAFRDSDTFVVNILADDQVHLSNHFAKPQEDKFKVVAHTDGIGGAPVLHGAAAHLECVKVATYPGGDHVVYLGRVERMSQAGRRPLAFAQGRYMVPYAHDLGPMSLGMGHAAPVPTEAIRLATDAMPRVSQELGDHTLCLAVWGNHGPTAIRWEPGVKPVSDQLRAGLVMSVTRSAAGRAFAAFMSPELTQRFIDEDLRLSRSKQESETSQREAFEAEVEQARSHGLARAAHPRRSSADGLTVNAFSAPIFDAEDRMLMALTVTSRAERLSPDWDGEVATGLKRAADSITLLVSTATRGIDPSGPANASSGEPSRAQSHGP